MIEGKGYFIWQIARTESGDIGSIVNLAMVSGLTHVLIKIADGTGAYNVSATDGDLVPPLVEALGVKGIQSLGWHYIYGNAPADEADRAIQRVQETGVVGYVISMRSANSKDLLRTWQPEFSCRHYEVD